MAWLLSMVSLLVAMQEAEVVPSEAEREAAAYAVHDVAMPDGIVLEVGGLLPRPDDAVLVSTRRGEIWRVEGVSTDTPTFSLFADGLQEPLGLLAAPMGQIDVAERGQVTRIIDRDQDGRADGFTVVCDGWEISGNYHEYAFGPRRDDDGNLWVTLNVPFGDQPFGVADWRGFAVRIDAAGNMEPVCGGLRSPAGLECAPWGDMLYTDNQGEWNGASKLSVLREGDFHGHPRGIHSAKLPESRVAHPGPMPDGILYQQAAREMEHLALPAVWFPYDKAGRSPSGFDFDESAGAFGPFAGQAFVGDQYEASLLRVAFESVHGVLQGAVFPFRHGLVSGVIRVAFDDAGGLLVGCSDRGWPSLGTAEWGLQRITWTGAVPFEIQELRVLPDGFRLVFTRPVDPDTAGDTESYSLQRYTYRLHSDYGSPEVDDWELDVRAAEVSGDGLSVDLRVDGLREGSVHELRAEGVTDPDGETLVHPDAYYTLRRLPGDPVPTRVVVVTDGEPSEGLAALLEAFGGRGWSVRVLQAGAPGSDAEGAVRDADLLVLACDLRATDPALFEPIRHYADAGRAVVALGEALSGAGLPDEGESTGDPGVFAAATLGGHAQQLGAAASIAPVSVPWITGERGDPRVDDVDEQGSEESDADDDEGDYRRGPEGDHGSHRILEGVGSWSNASRLATVHTDETRLAPGCEVLVAAGDEPVAWTLRHEGGRVFVTVLRESDLLAPAAHRLVLNGAAWAVGPR